MALNCQSHDCIHNDKTGKCFAKQIDIRGKNAKNSAGTTCNSHTTSTSEHAYEFANEFMATDKTPAAGSNIKCGAKTCKFNHNQVCNATDVNITNHHASCETFKQQ